MRWIGAIWMLFSTMVLCGQAGQITINRVELMPDEPAPYFMRDWKRVATGYDSMAFDRNRTGLYLPLVFIRDEGYNYPENESFGLDSYVGTYSDNSGEGINVLSALVGASLVGIDKTNQFGKNWILMSQDYFNRENGEDLYLNNIGGHSGNDWWYDMMPNVYFYQLYDLYGDVGDASSQFSTIADRMAEAVRAMGGKSTPWTRANMNYRAWDFLHMQPNPNGVHEPEAAGAFAWLLFNAWLETGALQHLQAAEWSMEFLSNLGSNPSYELQLPYGAYAAAKMNAVIGTEYEIEKLLFWIFNRGPLRGWGTIVGEWNGFDVSGLVGEANDGGNDYAFQLNGVQQAGALVPLVRYDKRFARAIGKWTLNVANATRFMYPGFLPSHLQDAYGWSSVYDPDGVMGYEALREVWNGNSPVSTGDALRSGWAATNLSLYSTSSIGYLGAIVEQTNVDKILRLDLLKTDFYGDAAYPSYLLYNPYSTQRSVAIDAGSEAVDIYDALTETFLATGVSGITSISIPADQAVSIVLAPASGTITFENNKMLINGIVVDYRQTQQAYNYPPRIQAFSAISNQVEKNTNVTLYAKGIDQETKDLIYTFFLPNDTISGLEKIITWQAPDTEGTYQLMLVATDENAQSDTAFLSIEVVAEINIAPVIQSLTASSRYTLPDGSIDLTAIVEDGNGDVINYDWSSSAGTISGTGNQVTWHAPSNEGITTVFLAVDDGRGGAAQVSITLLVTDLTEHVEGDIIAWYPFTGNAMDISGNNLHGTVSGAKLTADSIGQPLTAYQFDGVNDHIRVVNQAILNFSEGITVSAFVTPLTIGDKERFIISHGSWQNRWKISITPEGKLRWTLKNSNNAVKDLDSEFALAEDKLYHLACSYDGQFMAIYINGRLNSFTAFSGLINESPVDLEIGQLMPDDQGYNFHGVLDEIKIFDFALLPDSVAAESGVITSVEHPDPPFAVITLYPNPAAQTMTIALHEYRVQPVDLMISITDYLGRECRLESFGDARTKLIDVRGLLPGIYVLRLSTKQGEAVSRSFIVDKK